jgi:hypothetical protein
MRSRAILYAALTAFWLTVWLVTDKPYALGAACFFCGVLAEVVW